MRKLTTLLMCFCWVGTHAQNNIGSGNCLDFSANINNANHLSLGALSTINTQDFTIECWMKVNSVFDDEAFFSNKNWSSGNNTGIVFDVQDNGTNMKFNFKDPNNPRKDLTVAVHVLNRDWFHFAGTFKRGGYFVVYINGQAQDSLNVASITGSFASQYTYKLGQDGTGNYTWNGSNPRYNGKIDEFRIWNSVRTKQQIRDNMCHSLSGNEANLYAYYPCDDAYSANLNDLTANNNDGTWVNGNANNVKLSGAPIGNSSVNKYGNAISADSLQIITANHGTVTLNNFNAISGIHLYEVDNSPTLQQGLNVLLGNTVYFGAFVCDTVQNTSYGVKYNYNSYTSALNDEANLLLFNRSKNDQQPWTNSLAAANLATNNLLKSQVHSRKEWLLGTFSGLTCQSTDSIYLVGGSPTSATIGWQSAGNHWNVVWGLQGFNLNSGTLISNTSNNPITFNNLASGASYEMYVQDTCAGTGSGIWVGPFTFTGEQCLDPSQLTATNITGNSATLSWINNTPSANTFDIEWGLPGFTQGVGIPANGVALPYNLTGLGPNTSYAYYVRTVCGQNNFSGWAGPFTFTTADNAHITELEFPFSVVPNPFNESFVIKTSTHENLDLYLTDLQGKKINAVVLPINAFQTQINLTEGETGMYLLHIIKNEQHFTQRVIKISSK